MPSLQLGDNIPHRLKINALVALARQHNLHITSSISGELVPVAEAATCNLTHEGSYKEKRSTIPLVRLFHRVHSLNMRVSNKWVRLNKNAIPRSGVAKSQHRSYLGRR